MGLLSMVLSIALSMALGDDETLGEHKSHQIHENCS